VMMISEDRLQIFCSLLLRASQIAETRTHLHSLGFSQPPCSALQPTEQRAVEVKGGNSKKMVPFLKMFVLQSSVLNESRGFSQICAEEPAISDFLQRQAAAEIKYFQDKRSLSLHVVRFRRVFAFFGILFGIQQMLSRARPTAE